MHRKPKKAVKTNGFLMIFGVRGVQVGSKNRSKIDQKGRSTWEGILASIFGGFWWIFGGKLGSKIDQKSIQEGIEKTIEKWKAPRWPQSRNKAQQRPAEPGVQSPGEVPPYPGGETRTPPKRV